MNKIIKIIIEKFSGWVYLAAIVVVLVVIGTSFILLLDGKSIEALDLNRGVLMILISGMIIYIYKQRSKKS